MLFFSGVSIQDRVDFTKSLAIMLKSGITINEALIALEDQSGSDNFKKILSSVRASIENGNSLSKSFQKEEKVFGKVFVSMIRAGEQSGTLQENLQFLSDWLERSSDLRREVSAATLYPKMIFSAAILLGGGLAIFILPRLVPLFNSMGTELPLVTKIMLAISLYVQHNWLLNIIGLVVIWVAVVYLNKIYFVRKRFHYFYLKIPFIGSLLRNYQLALSMQLFSMLLRSGLSINESIGTVSESVTNIHYQEALTKVRIEVERGTTLSGSIKSYPDLYPKIVFSIAAVGEKSGTLVNSFEYLSEFYTKEVNMQAKKLPTIIEPLLLVFIAVIVGFVAIAVIMPIYGITSSISR